MQTDQTGAEVLSSVETAHKIRYLGRVCTSLTCCFAAAVATLLPGDRAAAGSSSAPGATTGLAVYAPTPEGLYLINITTGGVRNSTPNFASSFYDPFFFYQSPLEIVGAKVSFIVAPTLFAIDQKGSPSLLGLYNTYFGSQLTWDLGGGLGVGYRLSGYVPMKSEVAYNYGTIEHRFGASYVGNGWNLTANFQLGTPFADQSTGRMTAPNYLNLDLTATKKFNNWELGPIAYGSVDISRPYSSYAKQGQFAVGGLIGYDFGPVIVQLKGSTDVVERNYGGRDVRGWANIIVPLWVNTPSPVNSKKLEQRF
ncbi:transporter [Methylorubrum thiocyanatum]|jgi:hypothetical protein|uniref:transporter n=1 Tax=Methylorubrum thiocyanatum TaxID=47958 RepID=UPI00383A5977